MDPRSKKEKEERKTKERSNLQIILDSASVLDLRMRY
jgi:hypothetical protein